MMTLIAAALVAAQPAAPAPAPANTADHSSHQMAMGQGEQHKGMDCCKDCCKDMAKGHEDKSAEHKGHSAR